MEFVFWSLYRSQRAVKYLPQHEKLTFQISKFTKTSVYQLKGLKSDSNHRAPKKFLNLFLTSTLVCSVIQTPCSPLCSTLDSLPQLVAKLPCHLLVLLLLNEPCNKVFVRNKFKNFFGALWLEPNFRPFS